MQHRTQRYYFSRTKFYCKVIAEQKGKTNMITFDIVWSHLQTNLKVGTNIKNWTDLRGYMGDTMRVNAIRSDSIVVDSPSTKNLQVIPKDDFEKVWKNWADYKSQNVSREQLRDVTRFSKYIISILHWYEID